MKCPECHGKGKIWDNGDYDRDGIWIPHDNPTSYDCPYCNGTGKVEDETPSSKREKEYWDNHYGNR